MHSEWKAVSMIVWLSGLHLTNNVIRSEERVSRGVADGDLQDTLGNRRRE